MIKPLGSRILIEVEQVETTSSGIIVVKLKEQDTNIAKVLEAGAGTYDSRGNFTPNEVSIGDRVVIRRESGFPIEVDGRKLRLINEGDVIAIL
jgi:chaperonin GroES